MTKSTKIIMHALINKSLLFMMLEVGHGNNEHTAMEKVKL